MGIMLNLKNLGRKGKLCQRGIEEERTFPKVYVREGEKDKESIAATVAVPGDHCFPPVLA